MSVVGWPPHPITLRHVAIVNTADKDGFTPLYAARQNGNVEVVREFLNHGAQLEKSKEAGWSFISIAAVKGYFDLFRDVLKKCLV